MKEFDEKRKFQRFEIPGGEGKHKRTGLPTLLKDFSKSCPVMNVSVGGIALLCEEEFGQEEEVMIKLDAPNEAPLDLRAVVKWQGPIFLGTGKVVGFEFKTFSNGKSWNPPETFFVLRRLYARYVKDEKAE